MSKLTKRQIIQEIENILDPEASQPKKPNLLKFMKQRAIGLTPPSEPEIPQQPAMEETPPVKPQYPFAMSKK